MDVSDNRHAAIFGVGIGFIAFDSIVVALRIYARAAMLRALGTDDILMIVGAILNFGLSATIMIGSRYGIGKHALAIPESDTIPMLKSIWATRLLYTASMGLIKMSLLWFYLRLDPRKHMRWAVFFVMFINVGLSLASFIGAVAACSPPSLFWTDPASSSCMPMAQQQRFYEVNGILNIVTDIWTYLLPVPMLWGLQMVWRKKAAILGIFGLGSLSIAAACVRYNFVAKLPSAKEEYYILLADSLNWCTIEAYVAIFCGCAPSLSILIKTYAPSLFGTRGGKSAPSGGAGAGAGASYRLSHRNPLKSPRACGWGRRLGDTTLGSQDAIVTGDCGERGGSSGNGSNTDQNQEQEQKQDGIVMRTEIRMDVSMRGSTDRDTTYKKEYYDFGARRT